MPPATTRDEFPTGTLDMLILKTLGLCGKMHGFEIANAIVAGIFASFLLRSFRAKSEASVRMIPSDSRPFRKF